MTEFSSLGLTEELLKGTSKLGFTTPTPIQARAIPELLNSDGDFVVLAGTGTGKTAAFGLPLLQKLDPGFRGTQALILSPTRELCCQIAEDLKRFSAFLPEVSIVPVYGGASMGLQIRELKRNPRIIVATPGRLIDHLERGNIDLGQIRTLVLDEADEMLSMGFREELESILALTPGDKQTCLFSATMPRDIRAMVQNFLDNPREISSLKSEEEASTVDHNYLMVNHRDRFEALRRFIAKQQNFYGIVFCRTKDQTREIAVKLAEDGLSADAIHGDLSQMQRDYVMQRFRKGAVSILVATDVAARGIDVDSLTHVVHYELPHDAESYVHRSGRTGRAGREGMSLAIATPADRHKLRSLERRIKSGVNRIEVPTGNEILQHRIDTFVTELENAEELPRESADCMKGAIERLRGLSQEELIEKILHTQFREQIEYFSKKQDIRAAVQGPRERKGGFREQDSRKRGPRGRNEVDYVKVKFSMGSHEGLTKSEIIGLANRAMKGMRFPIGEVRLKKSSATIEVPRDISLELARRIEGKVIREKRQTA
ncbi:hypothetical protein B4O97_09610 [Marispirochaeta aestuarii]|uniref:DEAD/DEAH box helicase n=1 Tax=Marispirochaeta aestuarii TaxID=1963862 RepID=A0A1Y1RY83_9SPIO|nr:DEAD/DEAH box helicase [Marispirochaeta aestuarii]ORC35417.1 hypothetical protein B4O97_09610 [Marispirochaeta aestuarii]